MNIKSRYFCFIWAFPSGNTSQLVEVSQLVSKWIQLLLSFLCAFLLWEGSTEECFSYFRFSGSEENWKWKITETIRYIANGTFLSRGILHHQGMAPSWVRINFETKSSNFREEAKRSGYFHEGKAVASIFPGRQWYFITWSFLTAKSERLR